MPVWIALLTLRPEKSLVPVADVSGHACGDSRRSSGQATSISSSCRCIEKAIASIACTLEYAIISSCIMSSLLPPACISQHKHQSGQATATQVWIGQAAVMKGTLSLLLQDSHLWACLGTAMSSLLMRDAAHLMEGQNKTVAFCCHLPPETHDLVMRLI